MVASAPHTLIINEIFHSIQGESTHVGRPCAFVRLTYCNLRCAYCDTEYAFQEGKEMPIDEIISTVRLFECKLVEITGGEPLFQPNVYELMNRLCDEGFEVLLETGGSLDISVVDPRVKRIVDVKCPSSRMAKKNLWSNMDNLKAGDEIKFVIGTREDYDWAKDVIKQFSLDTRIVILMSPVFDVLEPVTLAEWILPDRLNVRLQVQMHKVIWSPETRGV